MVKVQGVGRKWEDRWEKAKLQGVGRKWKERSEMAKTEEGKSSHIVGLYVGLEESVEGDFRERRK